MDFIQAIVLSLIEGFSEFLPISSTGHLVLAATFLKITQTDFVKSFEIIIQSGAILAVCFLYYRKIISNFKLWPKLIIAFLPTSVVGLTFYKIIKNMLLGNSSITLITLFLGGILLIFLEKIYKEKENHLSSIDRVPYKKAFLIGLCQSLAIIPGVSRAGATIIGGMFFGLKRQTAVEFSFLLAIPTMAAATGLDLLKSNFRFSGQEFSLLLTGFIGSFITAVFAIKFLLKFIKTHTLIPFGVYRIILAIVFWILIVK